MTDEKGRRRQESSRAAMCGNGGQEPLLARPRGPRYTVCAKSIKSCPALCNPMYYSLPSSSVHGILQAGTLEWVAVPSSRGSSRPRGPTCISSLCCIGRRALYHQRHLGSRFSFYTGNYSEFPLFALLVHFTHLISSSAIS